MARNLLSVVCILIAAILFYGTALAQPAAPRDISENDSCPRLNTALQAEASTLTDVHGTIDDSSSCLFPQRAGFETWNTSETHSFAASHDLPITFGNTLDILKGPNSIVARAAATLNLPPAPVSRGGSAECIGNTFGFYLTTMEGCGYPYYSYVTQNRCNYDHLMIFAVGGNTSSIFPDTDIIAANEDPCMEGDRDLIDTVFGIGSVIPASIAEPWAIILIGSCLLGISIFRRKNH